MLEGVEAEERRLLFKHCDTREELKDWVHYFLELELPDCIVDSDSNCTPLDMVWDTYTHLVHGPKNDVSRRLYYASRDGGKCSKKGTLLLTKYKGLLPIEEVKIDDTIWSGWGWKVVTDWIHEGIKLGVKGILSNGAVLTCSSVHKVWSWPKGGKPGWHVLSSLSPGDCIWYEVSDKFSDETFNQTDFDHGYICGVIQGDGCTTQMDKRNMVSVTASDPVVKDAWFDFCRDKIGKEPRPGYGKNYRDYLVVGNGAREAVAALGIKAAYSFQKEIPVSCFRSKSTILGFVSGLFDTDGTWKRGGIEIAITAQTMLRQLQIALSSIGVEAKLRSSKKLKNGGNHLVHFLELSREESWKLKQMGAKFLAKKAGEQRPPASEDPHKTVPAWTVQEWEKNLPSMIGGGLGRKDGAPKPNFNLAHGGYQKRKVEESLDWASWSECVPEYVIDKWRERFSHNWLELQSVEPTTADFYDLTVEDDHSYWSDGFVSHNTLCESVTEVLILMHVGVPIVHLAAIEEQSKNAQRYLKDFFNKTNLRGFVHGDNKRETSVVYYRHTTDREALVLKEVEFRELEEKVQSQYEQIVARAEIVVATMASVNGKHGILFEDELDVLAQPKVHKEAQNIPSIIRHKDGRVTLPITILTSTRKSAFGIVQDEINRKDQTGLDVKHWNLIDVTEACPASRHRPDLPKVPIYSSKLQLRAVDEKTYCQMTPKEQEGFVKHDGYGGCLTNCRIFAACRGQLATKQHSTSTFLKPIQHTQNQFRNNDLDMALAQLMCLQPSSTGLIYARFEKARHVLTPAQAYEKMWGQPHANQKLSKAELMELIEERGMDHYGGIDWGDTHLFVYTHGVKDGRRMFVTHVVAASQLDINQRVEECLQFKKYQPEIFADTEAPDSIRVFRKAGFRMRAWKKGKVIEGISSVQAKLNPLLVDEPELFVVHDYGEDPQMDAYIRAITEWHWKLDAAGNPTLTPSEEHKDYNDALRYKILNVFPLKGTGVSAGLNVTIGPASDTLNTTPGVYDQENWVRQMINQRTGTETDQKVKNRPPMIIEVPEGSGYKSYYGEDAVSSKKKKNDTEPTSDAPVGKKGRLIWSLD